MSDSRCDLYRGDCLAVLALLAANSVQCVVTDPPYGSTDCHWDQVPDLDAWWTQIDRVTTQGAIVAIFAAQPFATRVINSRPKAFRYDLVWDKTRAVGHLNANRQPMRQHEQVLVFCRRPKLSTYKPQMLPGKPYRVDVKACAGGGVYGAYGARTTVNSGTRHPTSILRFDRPSRKTRIHRTEKPVPLLNWIVRSYSLPGQTVLDPFSGSGSTLEAATSAGRHAIGIERDPEIYEAAAGRMRPLLSPSRLTLHSAA